MKIYTKTGDDGTTALYGGTRIPKHHLRIDSYGTIDELNSYIGLLRDQEIEQHHYDMLLQIQNKLFIVGAILATDPEKAIEKNGKRQFITPKITAKDLQQLEDEIDQITSTLPPMTHFILPGGHQIVSLCHIARTICRRAERLTCALHEQAPFEIATLQYLNRLSDYLFVLARKLSRTLQVNEIKWIP